MCLQQHPETQVITGDDHIAHYGIDKEAEFECFVGRKTPGNYREGTLQEDTKATEWTEVGEFKGRCTMTWKRVTPEYLVEEDCCGKTTDLDPSRISSERCGPQNCEFIYQTHARGTISQNIPLADIYWACGKKYGLRKTLPKNWVGKCAWVKAV